MLRVVASLGVLSAALAWRLSGATLTLQVLLLNVAALVLAARSWFHAARRAKPPDVDAPYVDLEQLRLAEIDAYVSERLAAGDSVTQIASSTSWFDPEGDSRDRAG